MRMLRPSMRKKNGEVFFNQKISFLTVLANCFLCVRKRNVHFESYIRDLDSKKPVIWMGDMNVAPTEIGKEDAFSIPYIYLIQSITRVDLANPKSNWNKTPGYTEAETTAFKNILQRADTEDANKFVDVWRHLHPTDKHYTYFSYRFNCRTKGLGWRLDMCTSLSLSYHRKNMQTFFSNASCISCSRVERKDDGSCQDV